MRSNSGPWMRKSLILTLFVVVAACGSKSPTGPGTPTPPPVTPPRPSVQLNWAALARLFDDPLFRQLPQLLDNQAAAAPLNSAAQNLVNGIRARNADLTRGALVELAGARQTYGLTISGVQADRMLLTAISLFEMRGWGYINSADAAVDAPLASGAEVQVLGEGGQ